MAKQTGGGAEQPRTSPSSSSSSPIGLLVVATALVAAAIVYPLDSKVVVGDFEPEEYAGKDAGRAAEDHYFISNGVRCHAWLYLPEEKGTAKTKKSEDQDGKPPPPVVVMAHGFGAQKDFGLERYASVFVDRGLAVFMFDYRTFGASEGTPRNNVAPNMHVEDWNAAIDHVASGGLNGKVDPKRIGLWGTSFAGGHVLTVGSMRRNDTRIAGIVSQVPHLSGKRASLNGVKQRGVLGTLRLAAAALTDAARSLVGLSPVSVQIIGTRKDVAMMVVSETELVKYFSKHPKRRLGGWQNRTPARVGLKVRFYSPIDTIQNGPFEAPVMIIGGEKDDLCPPDLVQRAASYLPQSRLVMRDATHFEIYEPANSKPLAGEMASFFEECFYI